MGEVTSFRYDAIGNPIQIVLPDGSKLRFTYDDAGNVVRFIDANGSITRWSYGPCRRLLERTDPAGGAVSYVWGKEPNRLKQVINEKNETYTFFRDNCDNIIREVSFDGAERSFGYDAEGNVIAHTNANGETITIERDAMHRVIGQNLPDGERIRFAYDSVGNLIKAINSDIQISFERDPLGRITRDSQGDHWVERHYDSIGNIIRTETSLGHIVDYTADANGYITKLTTLGDKSFGFIRNANGQELERSMPGGAHLDQQFDSVGRLTAQDVFKSRVGNESSSEFISKASELLSRKFSYDNGGALTGVSDSYWGQVAYNYDPADRLLSVLRDQGICEYFDYDKASNITCKRTEGKITKNEQLEYGAGSRLIQKGSTRYEYDSEGRRIKMIRDVDTDNPKIWMYEWNAIDRLKQVTDPDGNIFSYNYDAFGRRVAKSSTNQGIKRDTKRAIWDGDVIIHEYSSEKSWSAWIYEVSNLAPIATVQNSKIYSIINDPAGTPEYFIDDTASLHHTGNRLAWGETINKNINVNNGIDCAIRFQGQYHDNETNLHYNFKRYYDPECGTYISQDPIRLRGGENLYQYAPNPISWIDPYGLANCPRDNNGRFRSSQDIAEEMTNLPLLANRNPGEIRQILRRRGYVQGTGSATSEVWLKNLPDGQTAAVRIDRPQGQPGMASHRPHVHRESVPTTEVHGGNYAHNAPGKVTYTDAGAASTPGTNPNHWDDVHIVRRPGRLP
jgi:RHS repeat-associated protein